MKRLWIYAIVGIGVLCGSSNSQAQTIDRTLAATAGGYIVGNSGSISFSMGEPVTETLSGNNMILLQGFQQPDELRITPVGIVDVAEKPALSVYPNPVASFLNVELPETNGMLIQLWDVSGKNLMNIQPSAINSQHVEIDVNNLAAGSYLLTVQNSTGSLWQYKVQKFSNR